MEKKSNFGKLFKGNNFSVFTVFMRHSKGGYKTGY